MKLLKINMSRSIFLFAFVGLTSFAVMARIIPHLPNAAPLTAIALVGSLYLGRKWAVLLPLSALFVSDLLIGFYDWKIMASVYISFALIGTLTWICRKHQGLAPVSTVVIGSPLLFFLITNAAVWLFSTWYTKDLTGLLYSYELGLPFLRNMIMGDIFYSILLLGIIEGARALLYRSHLVPRRSSSRFLANYLLS